MKLTPRMVANLGALIIIAMIALAVIALDIPQDNLRLLESMASGLFGWLSQSAFNTRRTPDDEQP